MRRLLILPSRPRPSTFSAIELNFCVRNGNRWILNAIVTAMVYFRRISPSLISLGIIHIFHIYHTPFFNRRQIFSQQIYNCIELFLVLNALAWLNFLHIIKVSYFLFALLSHSHEIKPSTY